MLSSPSISQVLKYAVPLLFSAWLLSFLISYESAYHGVVRQFKDERELFISDFLEHEVDGSFDGFGITGLCASKKWTPGLILSCDAAPGGVGVVKNAHLSCIRFAIEMGTELVVPRIVKRDQKDIANLTPHNGGGPQRGVPIDYFFDYDNLHETLSRFCPQMKVYRSMDELHDVPHKSYNFELGALDVARTNGSIIADMPHLPAQFKAYMDRVAPPATRRYPLRFNLAVTNWAFPTAFDTPSFARNFGRILRIRKDARTLAASALFNMQKQFNLALDPRSGIRNGSFVGIHLRTEKDGDTIFPSYENQAAYLLEYLASAHARVAFLATGATEEHITAFSTRARDFGVTVVLKRDVLHDADLALLNTLTWDQRALVDYEIMLRAGLMAGPSESSFAWNLALRRNGADGVSRGTHHVAPNVRVQWKDAHSAIFGASERGLLYMATIWP